jgi:hypothetical protein
MNGPAEMEAGQAALRDMRFLEGLLAMAPQGVPITLVRNGTGVAVALPNNSVMVCADNLRDALASLQIGWAP